MRKLVGLFLLVAALSCPATAASLFTGPYNAFNWTPLGFGNVDISGAPGDVVITGCDPFPGQQLFELTAIASGTVSFDWSYTSYDWFNSGFDPFGYFVIEFGNVHQHQLSSNSGPNSQSGSATFQVKVGDVFGFYVSNTDTQSNPAIATISNFDGPLPDSPEPGTFLLLGAGLMCILLGKR